MTDDSLHPTDRFSSRVREYVRHRPGYPPELLPLLRARCSLTRDSVVADIGSGTGIFTRLLLENGNPVCAVEPNAEMRQAAERALTGFPNFQSAAAPAEATGLPERSVDLITAAQAAHWFDIPKAKAEFCRIAKREGRLMLVWNTRRTDSTAFLCEYDALLDRCATEHREVIGRETNEDRVREIFAPAVCERHMLENAQQFDCQGLIGRTLSSSYSPHPVIPVTNRWSASCARCLSATSGRAASPSNTTRASIWAVRRSPHRKEAKNRKIDATTVAAPSI